MNIAKYKSDTSIPQLSKLFLIIENRMLREAMTALFQKQPDFVLADSIRYSSSAYTLIAASACDILLTDQASASAFPANFISDLLSLSPGRKSILFGMENDPELFLEAVRSGTSGYLLGEASAEETIAAVRRVVAGEAVSPPCLCHHLFQFVARSAREGSMILNQRQAVRLDSSPAAAHGTACSRLYEQRNCRIYADFRIYGQKSCPPHYASLECSEPLCCSSDRL